MTATITTEQVIEKVQGLRKELKEGDISREEYSDYMKSFSYVLGTDFMKDVLEKVGYLYKESK